jgi:predicted nucleotidyltransferase
MRTCGIVSEYNPFHNGHKYHIEKTKEELGVNCVVCVMSSNFTQRGDIAIFNMYDRARVAVENGADVVLSIPPQFVLNSAQYYAYYAVYILNALNGIDYLSFGSECGDLELLEKQARDININDLKENLAKGMTYAKAASNSDILKEPNNTLAVEYIRALRKLNSSILPFTIKRNKALHNDDFAVDEFSSASFIRNEIRNGENIDKLVPSNSDYNLLKPIFDDRIASLLTYRLTLGDEFDFENHQNISEGLNNRILKYKSSKSIAEFIDNIKCKRYTETRIRRALYSILLDIKKGSSEPLVPSYTRLLAISNIGQAFLNETKKSHNIKIYSKITKKDINTNSQLKRELVCNDIYDKLKTII